MKVTYNCPFVIRQDYLKFGGSTSFANQEIRHQAIVRGRAEYLHRALREVEKFNSANPKRIGHLISYFIYRAVLASIKTVMTKKSNHEGLTRAAQYFYDYYGDYYAEENEEVEYNPYYSLAGHLGSLAFTHVLYPSPTLDLWENLHWQQNHVYWAGTPREQCRELLRFIELREPEEVEKDLAKYIGSPLFRREYLGRADIKNLRIKILLGEIHPLVLKLSGMEEVLKKSLSLGYGAGNLLFLQSQVVDSFLGIIEILKTLPPDLEYRYLETAANVKEHCYEIARRFATIRDAYYLQSYLNTLEVDYKSVENETLYWLALSGEERISGDDEYRIGGFLERLSSS